MSSKKTHKTQAPRLPPQPPPGPLVPVGNQPPPIGLPDLSQMALGLNNSLTQLWNLFMIINGVVVGWLFTTQKTFGIKERALSTALYILFVLINFNTLHKMYGWLENILRSVNIAAGKLDGPEHELLKRTLMDVGIPGGKSLGYVAYILAFVVVLASIWLEPLLTLFRS
jgi:hypothetical protein